jgi:hypothetical protein
VRWLALGTVVASLDCGSDSSGPSIETYRVEAGGPSRDAGPPS